MIRFICECGKQLQVREEDVGKVVVCPSCDQRLTVPEEPPPSKGVQRERPIHSGEPEWEEAEESANRPRRQPSGNSGKAIASLVLGILALFCSILAGLPAVILGILAMRDIGRSRGRLSGQGLAIAGIVTACACTLVSCGLIIPIGLLLPAVQRVREAANRMQSQNNLKEIALAMLNYQDTYQNLPAPGVGNPAKRIVGQKPLLSWRVAILPFLGENALYNEFKHDEPWDSPHNIRLLPRMPKVYNCLAVSTRPGETIYQVFVGNGAAFEKTKLTKLPADFLDGTANTILVVEAAQSVPWTKPEDIPFDPKNAIKPLLNDHSHGGFLVAMADASTRYVPKEISENTLKAAITRDGGEVLGPDW